MARYKPYYKYKRDRYKYKPCKWKPHGEWVEEEYGFDEHLSSAPYHYHQQPKSQLLNILLILAFVAGAGFFTQIRTDSPLPSPEYP